MPISIPFPEIACNGSRYVLLQGSKGAVVGLAVGLTGVWAASRRFPGFRLQRHATVVQGILVFCCYCGYLGDGCG